MTGRKPVKILALCTKWDLFLNPLTYYENYINNQGLKDKLTYCSSCAMLYLYKGDGCAYRLAHNKQRGSVEISQLLLWIWNDERFSFLTVVKKENLSSFHNKEEVTCIKASWFLLDTNMAVLEHFIAEATVRYNTMQERLTPIVENEKRDSIWVKGPLRNGAEFLF